MSSILSVRAAARVCVNLRLGSLYHTNLLILSFLRKSFISPAFTFRPLLFSRGIMCIVNFTLARAFRAISLSVICNIYLLKDSLTFGIISPLLPLVIDRIDFKGPLTFPFCFRSFFPLFSTTKFKLVESY